MRTDSVRVLGGTFSNLYMQQFATEPSKKYRLLKRELKNYFIEFNMFYNFEDVLMGQFENLIHQLNHYDNEDNLSKWFNDNYLQKWGSLEYTNHEQIQVKQSNRKHRAKWELVYSRTRVQSTEAFVVWPCINRHLS